MGHLKENHALIVLNGKPCSSNLLNWLTDHTAFTVCADGAFDWFRKFDQRINIVAGDMDSIIAEIPKNIKTLQLHNQNKTDFEKIIDFLISEGYDTFSIIGSTGKENDHFLSNLFVLSNFAKEISFSLYDDEQRIELVNDRHFSFKTEGKGVMISVFGWPAASFVKSQGLLYPLDSLKLDFHHIGSRNQSTEKEITIEKAFGTYLLFINESPLSLTNK